jgi:hypothetical protein
VTRSLRVHFYVDQNDTWCIRGSAAPLHGRPPKPTPRAPSTHHLPTIQLRPIYLALNTLHPLPQLPRLRTPLIAIPKVRSINANQTPPFLAHTTLLTLGHISLENFIFITHNLLRICASKESIPNRPPPFVHSILLRPPRSTHQCAVHAAPRYGLEKGGRVARCADGFGGGLCWRSGGLDTVDPVALVG